MTEDKREDLNLCQYKQDVLSNLPDEILLTILDRLNVCDAARTSVLSRRWCKLPSMLSRLDIDVNDFVDGFEWTSEGIVRSSIIVMEVTKNMLARRDSSRSTIHFLSVTFFLREDHPIIIGQAVGHTMETHKVELAEFKVLTERDDCDDEDLVDYGRQFMLFFHACPNAFGGLTRLNLENLTFGELDIYNILNTCKRLKHLRMFNCDSGSGSMLQLEHSQLSELAIIKCYFERVELNSLPRLTKMIFEDWLSFEDPISFGNVPLLQAVSLTNVGLSSHNMVKLSKFLGGICLRDLKLGFCSEKIWVQPEKLTKRQAFMFRQIRFVDLVNIPKGYDLSWTFFILEAAPNLKDLFLAVWDHLCVMETDPEVRKEQSYCETKGVAWELCTSSFQHHSLAKLVIFGFRLRDDYIIKYVRRVMEAAVNLEGVFLHGRLWCHKCRTDPTQLLETSPNLPVPSERSRNVWKDFAEMFITKGINTSAIVHLKTDRALADAHFAKLHSL